MHTTCARAHWRRAAVPICLGCVHVPVLLDCAPRLPHQGHLNRQAPSHTCCLSSTPVPPSTAKATASRHSVQLWAHSTTGQANAHAPPGAQHAKRGGCRVRAQTCIAGTRKTTETTSRPPCFQANTHTQHAWRMPRQPPAASRALESMHRCGRRACAEGRRGEGRGNTLQDPLAEYMGYAARPTY